MSSVSFLLQVCTHPGHVRPNWGRFTKKGRPRSVFPKNCPQKNMVYFAKNELAQCLHILRCMISSWPLKSNTTKELGYCPRWRLPRLRPWSFNLPTTNENKHQNPPQVHWKLHDHKMSWLQDPDVPLYFPGFRILGGKTTQDLHPKAQRNHWNQEHS